MSVYDRCQHCHHLWHGLECESKTYKAEGNRWKRVLCGCPSAWEPPAVLVEGDVLEAVRRDA